MKIYHQAGHNTVWNKQSLENDNAGDGIIFSPVHNSYEKIVELPEDLKERSLFDPQFYVPDSQKKNLNTYGFFPEKITEGFSTDDFASTALEAAEKCLEFQINNNFESLIIPTRFIPDMHTDYITKQKSFSVEPFLQCLEQFGTDKKIFVTLPLTIPMISDDVTFRNNLLNWITSYQEIDGIYILVNFNEPSKQIKNFEKLFSYIQFIQDAMNADLEVIIGYCNTEGLVLSILDPYAITIGAYENTRGFSIDKFVDSDSIRQGPAPRLYFPKLFNWIRFDTAQEIREDHPALWDKIYTPTDHAESLFESDQPAHFTKPGLYKHHFLLIAKQYDLIREKEPIDRLLSLREEIHEAHNLYNEIEEKGIMFYDSNCKGEHLPVWNRVLNKAQNIIE